MADRTISLDSFIQPFNEHWLGVDDHRLPAHAADLRARHVHAVPGAARRPSTSWSSSRSTRSRDASRPPLLAAGVAVVLAVLRERLREPVLGDAGGLPHLDRPGSGRGAAAGRRPDRGPDRGRDRAADRRDDDLGVRHLHARARRPGPAVRPIAPAARRRRCSSRASSTSRGTSSTVDPAWRTHATRSRSTPLLGVPKFVWRASGPRSGPSLGVGPQLGRSRPLALAVGVIVQLVRRRIRPGADGRGLRGDRRSCTAILALIRAQLFDGAAIYSRYAYVSGIFALLGLTALVGGRGHPRNEEAATRRRSRGFVAVAPWRSSGTCGCSSPGARLFEDRAAHTRAAGDGGPGRDAGGRGSGQGDVAGPDGHAPARGAAEAYGSRSRTRWRAIGCRRWIGRSIEEIGQELVAQAGA